MRTLLFNIGWNAPQYKTKVKKMEEIMTEIKDHYLGGLVSISKADGRLIVESGLSGIDLRDIIAWVKENEPMLLE